MGIANQRLLVQPFCSERWETAFLDFRNGFCLFSFFFLHSNSHISFLCNSWNPGVLSVFSFSRDFCVYCCADIVGFGFCGFFFFSRCVLIVTSIIAFQTFLGELLGHVTKFLQLWFYLLPFLGWFYSVLARFIVTLCETGSRKLNKYFAHWPKFDIYFLWWLINGV